MVQQGNSISKKMGISDRKNLARTLLDHAERVMHRLFSDGDLMDFLALLSRLPNYHFRNLLGRSYGLA